MPNPINIKELIADREAGSRHFSQRLASSVEQMEADMRRKERLPDLEAAYIEAVNIIRQVASGVGGTRHVLAARRFLGGAE